MPRLLSDSSVPTWLRDMGRKEQADAIHPRRPAARKRTLVQFASELFSCAPRTAPV